MADRPRSGRPSKLGATGEATLRALAAAQPDATLPAHAARLEAETGIHLSPSHLGRLLRRLDLPLTKRP